MDQSIRAKELQFCSFFPVSWVLDSQAKEVSKVIDTIREISVEDGFVRDPAIIDSLQQFCILCCFDYLLT